MKENTLIKAFYAIKMTYKINAAHLILKLVNM
jgi:hypothetical protein